MKMPAQEFKPGLKRHHKILIGGFSTIIIAFMIVSGILIYLSYIKIELLENKLNKNQLETQSKINEMTTSIIQTKESVISLDKSISTEIKQLRAETSADFSGIIEDAIESVVTIKTDVSQGTGFIINDEGYLITNAHVLAGGRVVSAITSDHNERDAKFIGYSEELDIALLKISGDYNSIKLADSDEIQVGEKVIAIGNPLGLQFSVSEGIISGVNRPGPSGIEAYIQTDAALNPGNSGGPLINKQGEVIGINNFKIGGSENLGFALESNYIRDAVNEISGQVLNETLI